MKTQARTFRLILLLMSSVLSLNPVSAQEFLNMGVVYDFEIGDEFHYKTHSEESSQWQAYHETDELENFTITGKTFSATNDTVFYKLECIHRIIRSGEIRDTMFVQEVFYTNLDRTTKQVCNGYQGSTPNHSNPEQFNGRIQNSFSDGDFNGSSGLGYAAGLGIFRTWGNYSGQGNSTQYERSLVYYKKGEEEWGTRTQAIPEFPNSNSSIRIYPNPPIDETTIVREGTDDAILIVSDCQGRKVLTEKFEGQIKTLSTSSLTPGIYIVSTVVGNKSESAILIIQ
ncbi:MAG: T9SS type A sorting domain-containing protein [Bacteroidales bacterium]|nr:T9SS type A sorting domain-containing protein [Bacteroidales bacterium]